MSIRQTKLESEVFAINKILHRYESIKNKNILHVFWQNLKSEKSKHSYKLFSFFTSKEDKKRYKQEAKFSKLFYKLVQFGITDNVENFWDDLKKITNARELTLHQKINTLNKYIALIIYELDQQRLTENNNLQYYQIIALKKAYLAWVRSLESVGEDEHKFYIYRKGKFTNRRKPEDKFYELEFNNDGVKVKPKNQNIFKQGFFKVAGLVVIITAIAQGLVPAVLSAAVSGGVFASILVIGVPSILINYVLYKAAVNNLAKDIWHKRLLTDHNGKFIWPSLPLFIVALCGGITYGTMAFTTSLAAYQAILLMILPAVSPGLLVILMGIAAVSAVFVCISLTALFFGSIVEMIRSGILNSIKNFFWENFLQRFYQKDTNFWLNLCIAILKAGIYIALVAATSYFIILESALLFSMAVGVLSIPFLALALVLIAVPANILFTFTVYKLVVDTLIALPTTLVNFVKSFIKALSNPVQLYEFIKTTLKFVFLSVLNFIEAKGTGQGMVEELKNPVCQTILSPFGINSHGGFINIAGFGTGFFDDGAANHEGVIEMTLEQHDVQPSEKITVPNLLEPELVCTAAESTANNNDDVSSVSRLISLSNKGLQRSKSNDEINSTSVSQQQSIKRRSSAP